MSKKLAVGKLPADLLERLLRNAPLLDRRVQLGPGIGLDCAVIDLGETYLVLKTDPITFATDAIGWYAVQVNANDLATTGAIPRWMLVTLLLPEVGTTSDHVDEIFNQIYRACDAIHVSVIGGHTEITYGLERPILVATMIGEVPREQLITPKGAHAGDLILLTKGVPIEGIAIIARELPESLKSELTAQELEQAANYIYDPGISVLKEAQIAISSGYVTAMHDPTEGGLKAAIWEMAIASDHTFVIDLTTIHIPTLANRVCRLLEIDPFALITSGSLLLTVRSSDAVQICQAVESKGIPCCVVGYVEQGPPVVYTEHFGKREQVDRPLRDEITKLFERF